MKSKVLVTGGAGFIGSHVVDALLETGYDVTIMDNLCTGRIENINPFCAVIIADVENKEAWEVLPKFKYVFHLAALARILPSIENPLPSHNTNINGTLNVLEYCRKEGAKLIFSSSSSIYAGTILPTDEGGEVSLINPYTLQKYVCELYIQLYAKLYDLDYTILRYFNVFGERQILEGAYAALIGIFLKQKAEGKPFTITNDGEQRRDFTYVKDVAKANLMAMDWPREAFNIGTGKNYSVNELADKLGGVKEYIGERLGEARVTLADNRKAKSYGWTPTVDIMETI